MADPRFRGPVMGMNYQSDVPDGKRPYWKILVSIPRALDMEIRAYSEKFFFIRRWGAGEGTFVIRSQEDLEKLLADPTGYWPS